MSSEAPALPPCNLRKCQSAAEPYTLTGRDQVNQCLCQEHFLERAFNLSVTHWSPNTAEGGYHFLMPCQPAPVTISLYYF